VSNPRPLSYLLSHHPPEAFDRCVHLHGSPVCRRCLALYPLTLAVIIAQFTPLRLPIEADPWLVGLAMPATLEFILERLGRIGYHPRRVVVGSILLSVPLGRGFARYLRDPFDPWFWGLTLGFGLPALTAALWRGWKDLRGSSSPGSGPDDA
jgi:hypothetical protein